VNELALRELALFAGAGGGILGGKLLGWNTVCAVEIDPYARSVLLARQRDGALPRFPIWDDVRTFNGAPWRGSVDVISGGFPCQDISCAGKKSGIDGNKSGLWKEMARIVCEVRPCFVFVENSPDLTSRGLGVVLGDLASMGYDAKWGVLGARHVGAPHKRDRIWIVADANGNKHKGSAQADRGTPGQSIPGGWWAIEPAVGRVANGVAHRTNRLRAIGNGQVPAVARLAWKTLTGG
jgi:DNA (cytosine-5)-methyltransferase 1